MEIDSIGQLVIADCKWPEAMEELALNEGSWLPDEPCSWKETAMKFNVEVDCTPEEARRFLGLPDVTPIQDAMSEHIQERITTAMSMFEPEALLKTWFPLGGAGMEQFQNAFRAASQAATTEKDK